MSTQAQFCGVERSWYSTLPTAALRLAAASNPSSSISNNCSGSLVEKFNKLQGGHKRMSEVIAQELIRLSGVYGIGRLGFLTLTFADEPKSARDALKKFHTFSDKWIKIRYVKAVRVLERGEKNGRLHFHCVVVCPFDIRTGFDFQAVARGDYRSANDFLRAEWKELRTACLKYGFGRSELLPVKSTAEGIARYVGSYIGKHVRSRVESDKGVRTVGFVGYQKEYRDSKTGEKYRASPDRASSTMFGFNTPNGALWRHKVSKWAACLGYETFEQLRTCLGPRWCHFFYDEIMMESIIDVDFLNVPQKCIDADLISKEEIKARWTKRRLDHQ